MTKQPIRVGDTFRSSKSTWLVTECLGFGRGYWVVSVPERTRQTIFKRHTLENMRRTESAA